MFNCCCCCCGIGVGAAANNEVDDEADDDDTCNFDELESINKTFELVLALLGGICVAFKGSGGGGDIAFLLFCSFIISSTKLSGKTPIRPLISPFHQPSSSKFLRCIV